MGDSELRQRSHKPVEATTFQSSDIRPISTSKDGPATTSDSGLPIKDPPGSCGLPFIGPFLDKMSFYWVEGGSPGYYISRMQKYKSTVFRMNTVPGPPFYPDPRVVVLLDQKSYLTLFDMDKVEKKDVFTGSYQVNLGFTGGYRVVPYLDPSEEKHTPLKQFCMEILKSRHKSVVPELHNSLTPLFDSWEAGLKNNAKINITSDLGVATLRFKCKTFMGVDPVDPKVEANLTSGALGTILGPLNTVLLWVLPQILPVMVVPVPKYLKPLLAPLLELLTHTIPFPGFVVKPVYNKILAFFRVHSQEVLDIAVTKYGLEREEALHNFVFNIIFNSWAGIYKLFPSIMRRLSSTSVEFQRELSTEVRNAIQEYGGLDFPALEAMPLAQSAAYEVLRMDPPVRYQYGRAKKDLIIESYDAAFRVRKGELLAGGLEVAHSDPHVFTDPLSYNPKRFMGEEGEKLLNNLLWANGPQTETPTTSNKHCPGMHFISFISKMFIAEIYARPKNTTFTTPFSRNMAKSTNAEIIETSVTSSSIRPKKGDFLTRSKIMC
ncbi:hypothetical protein R1sor_008267 [Riccia sorocarpa]|uniref:Cytochrome P450 n=1 Tax=Riccia sorocarpa TaxID=122646 RepID=A0ABD3HX20_9MARC